MRKINKHIIHCSDSPDDKNVTVSDIDCWHRQRGFDSIGYHFVIYKDGTIHRGRPVEQVGAHCEGHNSDSIGTCLIGRTMFSEAQFDTLRTLHETLRSFYPDISHFGHHDFNPNKTCPNFDVDTVIT